MSRVDALWQGLGAKLFIGALAFGLHLAGAARAAEDFTFFESKIRPLLAEQCYECHSAAKKQKGNLVLDTKEGALKGGDTSPAIVPGNAAKSLLIEAVKWSNKDLQMPPKHQLSAQQIADLDTWINQGAPDPRTGAATLAKIDQYLEDAKKHWAFLPIQKGHQSLDELAGTTQAVSADKRTLCRRAYLDLLGEPPTYDEVNHFAADSSADAFAKLVDKLLADPRYGERWGRHWLDVARYADNDGQNGGGDGTFPYAWTYRDYVIQAFNSDKPYARLLQEQIAADQLDTAQDPRTLSALGFLIVGWRKDGRIDDDTLDDTIDVIGRGLMGLTIGCARCHDHKLEPITTKDYYGLYSILKSCKEPDNIPTLPQADSADVQAFRKENAQLRQTFAEASVQGASEALHTARSRVGDYLAMAQEVGWKNRYEAKQVQDLCIKRRLVPSMHDRTVASRKSWIEAHPEIFGPFLEFITKTKLDPAPTLHPLVAKAFATPATTLEEFAKRYNEIFAPIDTSWRDLAKSEITKPVELTQEEKDLFISDFFPFMDNFQPRFFERLDAIETKLTLAKPDEESLRQILIATASPFKLTPKALRGSGILGEDDKRKQLEKVVKLTKEHPGAPARPMAFVDAPKPFNGYVYVRGDASKKGPDAPRQFLTVLRHVSPEPFPKDKSGRLELAKAITSRDNPLTARVIVNRVWGWHFGTAIVPTPSNFGFRGERPSNQPLLDHLAAWFMDHGWRFKELHRYIMLSKAYQRADYSMQPLEFEPFRDSVLAVSGRLSDTRYGKAKRGAETTRRTVYDFVDRKMLPSLYRSFDFPNPNFSTAQRARTALAPRALILMNSPLIVDSAKALAAELTQSLPDQTSRIEELYRRVLQRSPESAELREAQEYLAAYPEHDQVHPESKDWRYGYGAFDAANKSVKQFTSLSGFDGKAFRGSVKTADGKTEGVMLDAMGGDSGATAEMATIRRWVAPMDGEIHIAAELTHKSAATGGVVARILSSRSGLLGEWTVQAGSINTDVAKVAVHEGETIDFIVTSADGKDTGVYQWSPSIQMPNVPMPGMPGMARRWDARTDFADPSKPPPPLTAWEELCQALLLSPEFAVTE